MIAHVAAAGEGRGRVLLWLGNSTETSAPAIEAAMLLARAYQSEVESLFVEDSQLFDLTDFPFARFIGVDGAGWQSLPRGDLERKVLFVGAALHRKVAEVAQRASIPFRSRVVRDDPLRAVARACADNGPWNVITLAEPFGAGDEVRLGQIFADVADTTGVVVAGPMARRTQGAVVVVVEQFERLEPMLRVAERLAGVTAGSVKVMLVGDRVDDLSWMEGRVRLLFGETNTPQHLETVLAARGDVVPVVEAARRHSCGFLLAQFGGQLVSQDTSLRPLASALECPLLLVR
jgi:hypothetical protein